MKQYTYDSFSELRNEYKKMIYGIETAFPSLRRLQQRIAETRAGGTYTVETPVVYNTALDAFTVHDEIKLILVGDNPGRREQEERNRAYLVGNSGKLAASFFGRFPELGIDFRKNVLILNKTPVHTARTNELLELTASGGDELVRIVRKSQEDCARLLFQFWNIVSHDTPVPVWIIGYSEMKKKGIFETYTAELARLARQDSRFYQSLYFYRHFSMNQFTIDLNKKRAPGESVQNALARIGKEYRFRILPLNEGGGVFVLCGPKHCGKTAAGAALSGCSFIDLDVEIESVSGRTARELYEEGVDIFRAAETAALRQALSAASGTVLVIAAGGGITDNTPAMALLKESRAALVFLRVSAKTAWERIRARPLPPFLRTKNPEETHRLLHERRNANCKKAAAYTIEAEGKTPVQIAAEIAALFEKR